MIIIFALSKLSPLYSRSVGLLAVALLVICLLTIELGSAVKPRIRYWQFGGLFVGGIALGYAALALQGGIR